MVGPWPSLVCEYILSAVTIFKIELVIMQLLPMSNNHICMYVYVHTLLGMHHQTITAVTMASSNATQASLVLLVWVAAVSKAGQGEFDQCTSIFKCAVYHLSRNTCSAATCPTRTETHMHLSSPHTYIEPDRPCEISQLYM